MSSWWGGRVQGGIPQKGVRKCNVGGVRARGQWRCAQAGGGTQGGDWGNLFFFLTTLPGLWGILVPRPGVEPTAPKWKAVQVLTIGLPGNSLAVTTLWLSLNPEWFLGREYISSTALSRWRQELVPICVRDHSRGGPWSHMERLVLPRSTRNRCQWASWGPRQASQKILSGHWDCWHTSHPSCSLILSKNTPFWSSSPQPAPQLPSTPNPGPLPFSPFTSSSFTPCCWLPRFHLKCIHFKT